MDRRQLLRVMSASATLAGLSPGQLAAIMEAGVTSLTARAFFTSEQREAVDAMAEAIIPTTDTPGASEAGVAEFIEAIVSEWYDAEQREHFMRGLAHLDEHSEALTGVRFPHVGADTQSAILARLEAEGATMMEARSDAPTPFFHRFRGLVLYGYYNSEVGLREELMFQRLPGRYDGCVDVREVTRPVPGVDRG
jgi:hypothetical protein